MEDQLIGPAIVGLVGVIVGAIVGFVSNWLSLRHDAKQRKVDREMGLRRQVYLDAAKALAKVGSLLGKFSQANFDLQEMVDSPVSQAGWYNNVQVVATVETVEAFARAEAHYRASLIELVLKRYELDKIRERLESIKARNNQLAEYQQALHSSLKADTRVAGSVKTDLPAFSHEIMDVQKEIERLEREKSGLLPERESRHKDLVLSVSRITHEHRRLTAELIIQLRRELKLPLDSVRYRSVIEEGLEASEAAVRKLVEEGPAADWKRS